jgi:L-amino acid N-acyltransferase YncA
LIIREATAADWPEIAGFFLETPVQSGTSFVLDRRPDFAALPALRGQFRTFMVFQRQRLVGTATALWHLARDGADTTTVGEIIDLRVAPCARGGRAVSQLLHAVYAVFVAERVDWIVCLIGKHNRAAIPTVAGRAGLPRLEFLEDFASVHFIAARLPHLFAASEVTVRAAEPSDAVLLGALCAQSCATRRFAPSEPLEWPHPTGRYRAWLAFEPDGTPCGALVIWDGGSVRRLRIVRYSTADLPLRIAVGVAARCGMANPLPAPNEVFGLWASSVVTVRHDDRRILRALLAAALSAAVAAGQHVLQINLSAHDPLLRRLPPYPRSTYWSTLYGCRRQGAPTSQHELKRHHADLARV